MRPGKSAAVVYPRGQSPGDKKKKRKEKRKTTEKSVEYRRYSNLYWSSYESEARLKKKTKKKRKVRRIPPVSLEIAKCLWENADIFHLPNTVVLATYFYITKTTTHSLHNTLPRETTKRFNWHD